MVLVLGKSLLCPAFEVICLFEGSPVLINKSPLCDCNGQVIWEQCLPKKGMEESGYKEKGHHGRGHERKGECQNFTYNCGDMLCIFDGGH